MGFILHLLSNRFANKKKFKNIVDRSSFIVAVDGGLKLAANFDILSKINLAIGDFDTTKNPEKYLDKDKIITYPTKKDLTDSIISYNYVKDKYEFKNFKHIFFSVTGKREDHFLSLIFYFLNQIVDNKNNFNKSLLNIEFQNDFETIFIVPEGKYNILNQKGKLFSFFPLSNINKLNIEPVEYKFSRYIPQFYSNGISNIFLNNNVTLEFEGNSALLFIENKDGKEIQIEKIR